MANKERKPGRPIGSQARQNIIEILYFYRQLHGYEIYKIYSELFPSVTMRLIYYHLKKGVSTGEFRIAKIDIKTGTYSWGGSVQNIIYELDTGAKPLGNNIVKKHFDKIVNEGIGK